MNTVVFDTESDGFVYEAKQMWCLVTIEESTKKCQKFSGQNLEKGFRELMRATTIIGHNVIKHDIPLIKKLYPWWDYHGLVIDTLLLSQLLNPDRWGGHGLAAWGERFGQKKPEHEDWSKFSEEMLHRCVQDTEINLKTYHELIREAGEPIEGVRVYG